MKKILLVGEFTEVYRSVGEALADEYQVQFCPAETETMHGIIKLFSPDLIVICMPGLEPLDSNIFSTLNSRWDQLPGLEPLDNDIFSELNSRWGQLPVLVISTQENFEHIKWHCDDKRYKARFIPIKNSEILEACFNMIDPERIETPEEDLIWFGKKTNLHRKKILVVDDAALMLRSIKAMLEDEYDIILAKSGEKALSSIAKEMPDLVLLDYNMPEMDGKETFEKIREMVGNSIPVIFLTGVNDRNKIIDVLTEKPAGYVLKPPDRDQLKEKILQALG